MKAALRRKIATSREKYRIVQRTKKSAANRLKVRTRMKQTSKHMALVKQLDELARELCMIRHGAYKLEGRSWYGPCAKCGQEKPLQWAHFNSRRFHALRWEPDNARPLCAGCHYGFAHHQPAAFRDWWLEQIGEVRFNALAMLLKTPRRPDLAGLKVLLTLELRGLTG